MSEVSSTDDGSGGVVGEKTESWGDVNPEVLDSDFCICESEFSRILPHVSPDSIVRHNFHQGADALSPGALWAPSLHRKIERAVEAKF